MGSTPGLGRSPGEGIGDPLQYSWASDDNELSCKAGDLGLIPGLGRSHGGGHGNPLQYSCLKILHGQRSLAGGIPWKSQTYLSNKHCYYYYRGRFKIILFSFLLYTMKISNLHENGKQCNYSLHPLPSFNIIDIWLVLLLGLLGSSDGKESACNVGDLSSIWVGKIPWRRAWQPTPVFLPEESPWTEGPGRLQSMG